MTRDEKIQLVADAIIDEMFAPHETPLPDDLAELYRTIARKVLDVHAQPSDGGVAGEPVAWRPIETAPRDKFIFLYCPEDGSRWLAKWQGDRWYGVDDNGLSRCGSSEGDPEVVTGWFLSHWQPLPSAPGSAALPPVPGNEGRDSNRCPICDWSFAESPEKGCVLGDCSYRPEDPTEQERIRKRREAIRGQSPPRSYLSRPSSVPGDDDAR